MEDYCVSHRRCYFMGSGFQGMEIQLNSSVIQAASREMNKNRIQLRSSLITEDSRVMEVNLLSIP